MIRLRCIRSAMAGCSRDFDMVPDGMDSEDDDDNRIDPEVQQFCENFTFEVG